MGRSCLCVYWSEVLSVLHIFIIINSIPHLTNISRKGEVVRPLSNVNMLSELSSQWRIDEHLSLGRLK